MTKDLTVGSPMKLILGFAVPLLFGMLFQQFYNLVDTMIVGKTLGVDALAGVGATGSINFMIVGFCMGVCNGFSIPVAREFGAGKHGELRRYVFHDYILSGAFAVVFTILSVVFCRQILLLMGTPDSIMDYSYGYIVVIFGGIPVVFLYNMVSGIIRALGDSKTPVVFLVIAAVLNIGLDLLFIMVFHMGVAGAGWATNVSQLLSGTACLIYMTKRYEVLRFQEGETRISKRHIQMLCLNGIPMGLQYSITAIGSVILQMAVNGLGAMAVASMTTASKAYQFFCCPFDALGSTMATYGSQNVGAGKVNRLGKGLRAANIIGTVYSIAAFLFLYFFARYVVLLFVDASETEVIQSATQFIVICSACFIPLALVNIIRFLIQGMGFAVFAVLAGVFEMAARIFAAVVLIPWLGFQGVCVANPLAWFAADAFLIPAFLYCRKRLLKWKAVD